MRRLTDLERRALVEVDLLDEGPIPDHVFAGLVELGYGYWGPPEADGVSYWHVTEAGRKALALDDLARKSTP